MNAPCGFRRDRGEEAGLGVEFEAQQGEKPASISG
jgi:hypothetical protein